MDTHSTKWKSIKITWYIYTSRKGGYEWPCIILSSSSYSLSSTHAIETRVVDMLFVSVSYICNTVDTKVDWITRLNIEFSFENNRSNENQFKQKYSFHSVDFGFTEEYLCVLSACVTTTFTFYSAIWYCLRSKDSLVISTM